MRPKASTRLAICGAIAGALLLVSPAGSSAQASGEAKAQVCGTQPGEEVGAYSFVKVRNMSCKRARKVAENAYDRFCELQDCTTDPSGGYVRGDVAFNGWECTVKLGYEFFRVRGEKPGKRFVQESAA